MEINNSINEKPFYLNDTKKIFQEEYLPLLKVPNIKFQEYVFGNVKVILENNNCFFSVIKNGVMDYSIPQMGGLDVYDINNTPNEILLQIMHEMDKNSVFFSVFQPSNYTFIFLLFLFVCFVGA